MSVRRRTLELGLEAASICVAAIALVIVLQASTVVEDGLDIDLSRGRGLVLLVSLILMAVGSYMFSRSWRSEEAASVEDDLADDTERPVEASAQVVRGTQERATAVKSPMTEDESTLYEMISESGGEMLQMHIVSSEIFSKAKVTRLLDKLEKRGLVVRERHGMTNRVRIIR